MTANRTIIIFGILILIACSCIYPKVHLSKDEKELLHYKSGKSMSFFRSNIELDTVYFRNSGYRNGFVPNFDFWWDKKVWADTSSRRGLYLSINASSNFPYGKYKERDLNLYLIIRFLKREDSEALQLSIDGFDEVYSLNQNTIDTLVFHRTPDGFCSACVAKVVWQKNLGLVEIEKKDGVNWRIIK